MLELRDLSRRYGDTVALDGLSLTAPPGEVVGFVGPNGAGKTTAMRIALGVLEPDAGEVRWKGDPATREVQRGFGYMPEERGLYPKMQVGRQLAYLAGLHGGPAADTAAAVRTIDRPARRTHGRKEKMTGVASNASISVCVIARQRLKPYSVERSVLTPQTGMAFAERRSRQHRPTT